jgi:arylformamidase
VQPRGSSDQWRVEFDADVEFSNGGALQVQGFRLDIADDDIGDDDLAELFIAHLGLLMVGSTTIKNKNLLREPHKGSRGVVVVRDTVRRVVDLTGADTQLCATAGDVPLASLVDLPGVLARLTGGAATVDHHALAPYQVDGRAVLVQAGSAAGPRMTAEAAALLARRNATLVGTEAAPLPEATELLNRHGIPVVTGLSRLQDLPPAGFRVHAVPAVDKATTDDRRPVRIYGVCDGG